MAFPVLIPAIDIYVTYRCNLRCTHCFVGEHLNLKTDFPFQSLATLITSCRQWETRELTLLGGEPTIYPFIVQAVDLANSAGLKIRLITNGQQGFAKFMQGYGGAARPEIGFSIDGSSARTHDAIRGARTFDHLIQNIKQSRVLGFPSHAIVSISKQNAHDVLQILNLCDELQFSYVNVHYVTSRGFAPSQIVLALHDWSELCAKIRDHTRKLSVEVRLEETFVKEGQDAGHCAVRDRSSLLFFPDGRVFICPMFIDVPGAHSFTWSSEGLVENFSKTSEQVLCAEDVPVHCPAMQFVNPRIARDAASQKISIRCIFNKTKLAPVKRA